VFKKKERRFVPLSSQSLNPIVESLQLGGFEGSVTARVAISALE
jgi:hypothetical protein